MKGLITLINKPVKEMFNTNNSYLQICDQLKSFSYVTSIFLQTTDYINWLTITTKV
jgi:hypothetical protein